MRFRLPCVLPVLLACLLIIPASGFAQNDSTEARVKSLIARMTLAEKISMLHGANEPAATNQGEAGYLPGIPRLGIPPMRFADGPPGVLTRVPAMAPTCTMGVAATFNVDDARKNGDVIGMEARSHGVAVALQPFINIARDFVFQRAYNTFGEDPFLTGQMGAAEVQGIQSQDVMAQAKHYVGYDTDNTNVYIGQQALHEIYVSPFAAASRAGASSIMCSYNKINGQYSCGNPETLNKILKGEVGFKGFVTSDWGATHGTDFINAGLDLEMPGPLPVSWAGPNFFVSFTPPPPGKPDDNPHGPALSDSGLPEETPTPAWHAEPEPKPFTNLETLVKQGKVSTDTIDQAVYRILFQMAKFGYLDGHEKLSITPEPIPQESPIVEKTALDAAVLLKNQDAALPLDSSALNNLAMIGPGARQLVAVGKTVEKAVGLPAQEVGPLAALEKLAGPSAHIRFAVDDDMEGQPIPASAFSHNGKPGLVRTIQGNTQIVPDINQTLSAKNALPADTTAIWTGTFTVPETGTYRIHLQGLGDFANLVIDKTYVAHYGLNWIHGDVTQAAQDNIFPTLDGLDNVRVAMKLTAGPHKIELRIQPDSSHHPAQVRLNWVTPSQQLQNRQHAIELAKSAHTAVVFVWSRVWAPFQLPGDQAELIRQVAAVNPNTIVVLNVSQPFAMPWLPKVKAVLQMWWPGDEGGWATAKLLLGQANPSGRLPFTWAKRLTDMPANDPAHPERSARGVNGRTTFSEGIFVGYRWFDSQHIDPLFPFGFGLSYTQFRYSDFTAKPASDGGADLQVKVENTGARAGDEVVEAYLKAPSNPPAGAQFAPNSLAAFTRIHLDPGQSGMAQLHIPPHQFEYWSTRQHGWRKAAGTRTIYVGSSSRDERQKATVNITQ